MDQKICKNCEHYHQHYILDGKRISRIYCGHCMLYRTKRKRPDSAACDRFVPAPPDEDAFASKEYLSKELLKFVLSLDLLPPIEDAGQKKK